MLATLGSIASQGGMPDHILLENGKVNEKYMIVEDKYYGYGGTDVQGIFPPGMTTQYPPIALNVSSFEQTGSQFRNEVRTQNPVQKSIYTTLCIDWRFVPGYYYDSNGNWVPYEYMFWCEEPSFIYPPTTRQVTRISITSPSFIFRVRSAFTYSDGPNRHNRLVIYKIWLE